MASESASVMTVRLLYPPNTRMNKMITAANESSNSNT